MKKKSLFAVFLLVSGLIVGCKRNDKLPTTSNSGSRGNYMVTMSDSLDVSPGEIHNEALEEYYNTYGPDTVGDLDYASMKLMTERFTTLFANKVGLEDPEEIENLINRDMDYMWSIGLFHPDSTLVPPDSFDYVCISSLPNANIRSAWFSILEQNFNNFNDHYNYASNALMSLTGLTQQEIDMNEGSLSVLGASYVLFVTRTTREIAQDVADADSFAWDIYEAATSGWAWTLNPTWRYAYVGYMSAKVSAARYKQLTN